MASSATEWAWEHSRARNGAFTVLLAITRQIDGNGAAEMTMAQIAGMARLSVRAARDGVRDLERLREVAVTPRPGGRSGYALCTVDPGRICRPTPADIAAPAESAALPTPAESAALPEKPQVNRTPAESAALGISDVLSTSRGSEVAEVKETPAKPSPPPRPDVERLCDHLATRIAANGSKRPAVTRKWRDACRLLIDKDGRTEDQVKTAIDWCQADEFWRVNILSMPTLREKYDRLRLDAIRKQNSAQRNGNGRQPTEDEYDEVRRIARYLDAQEETG